MLSYSILKEEGNFLVHNFSFQNSKNCMIKMICTKFLIHFFLRALIILNSLILILFLYTYQSNQPPSYSLLAFTCSNSEMGSESTERRQLAGSINTLGESFKVPTLSALCLNIEQKAKLFTV